MPRRTSAAPRALASLACLAALAFHAGDAGAQERAESRRELSALPALNFDADEGFGYGLLAELYQYAEGHQPYRYTVQPRLFLTTRGRRDLTLFVDAPGVIPGGWRLTSYAGIERHVAAPWYGIGNATTRDTLRENAGDPWFHRYGRRQLRLSGDVQRPIAGSRFRVLAGAGLARTVVDDTPFDSGATLLSLEARPGTGEPQWSNHLRAGLVWDTRDREVGPRRGRWSELLVQRSDPLLGADAGFTRTTLTWREYVPLGTRVVLAGRGILQQLSGEDIPFHELPVVQGSFRSTEGLGGSGTVRGLPKARYAGEAMAVWNAELRWHAASSRLRGRDVGVVLTSFVDAGRVWERSLKPAELWSGLHAGAGGGVRLAVGQSFVVALDVAHSAEATAPIYIGLGYAF